VGRMVIAPEVTLAGSRMDLKEILSRLERNEGHFPKAAIQEAIARRDRIVAIRGESAFRGNGFDEVLATLEERRHERGPTIDRQLGVLLRSL